MQPMSRPRPPYLQRHKTRHGKYVWYVQIGRGPLIRVAGEYGTSLFDASYREAISKAGDKPGPKIRASQGTLEWAWLNYKQSVAWERLSPATRKHRDNIMKRVAESAGAEPLSAITKRAIIDGMDRRSKTPFQALNFL